MNIYTKESQWDEPTRPAEPSSPAGPNKVPVALNTTPNCLEFRIHDIPYYLSLNLAPVGSVLEAYVFGMLTNIFLIF